MKTDQLTIIASNGIKIREYHNLALVPAFYYLPKYDLELCDPWVFQIPRNPHHIIDNPKALELIESDRFIGVLQYLYRHLVWQFLNVGMNIYTASENNPVYVLCSDLNLWLEGFYDYKILPTMQELLCNEEADMEFGYVSLEEFTKTMEFITQYVMMKHGYFGIVDVVKQYKEELTIRKTNLKRHQSEYAKEIEKLNKLRAEVVKSIQGESAFSQTMLAGLVEESEARVQSLKERCDEAQREVESSENLIKDLNTQYDEIISWSSLYDSASIEAKKMIINSMIKRVDVYRNYELNVELNMNIRQFFLGMEEQESYPITA